MTSSSSDILRCAELAVAEELAAENDFGDLKLKPVAEADVEVVSASSSSPKAPPDTASTTITSSTSSSTVSTGCTKNSEEPPQCGWLCWKPKCLQKIYNYKTALLLMCCFAFLQGVVVNGLTPLNTGSLERRFGLTSVETGWLNSAYDLAAATATLFLSYLADRRHKPRWLMISAICFTVGSFIFSLPHFIATPYSASVSRAPLCFPKSLSDLLTRSTTSQPSSSSISDNEAQCHADNADGGQSRSPEAYWQQVLLVGQIIQGVGGAIIYTVGIAFIDDFSEPNSSGFHVGLTFLSTAVGAASGYGAGSALLTLPVNFDRPDWPHFSRELVGPNYVGAWWLGYLMCSGLFAVVALGFSCFDYEMPETTHLTAKRVNETHDVKFSVKVDHESRVIVAIVDFLNSLLKLITNPVLVCVTLALISHALFSQGTQPFFVKIIENQFHISESKAGFIVGVIIIVGISSAAMTSGYIMKRLELTVRGALSMIIIAVFLSIAFSLCLLLHCDPEHIIGINVGYDALGLSRGADLATHMAIPGQHPLMSTCNAACNCSTFTYRPACHKPTAVQFFSACHAGCQGVKRLSPSDTYPVFTNCTCLASAIDPANSESDILHPGICDTTCSQFYPAIILLFFLLFTGFFTTVPLTSVVMRCVHGDQRSMALAFNQSCERFLGNIPGPLIIGRIIDLTCIFRREYCNSSKKGACFTYDSASLSVRLTALCVGLNSLGFFFYILAFLLYRPPSGQTLPEYFGELWETTLKKKRNGKPHHEKATEASSSQAELTTRSSSASISMNNVTSPPTSPAHTNFAYSDSSLDRTNNNKNVSSHSHPVV